ncbi:MFS transporter [bacterium]|nr:MFS transporter [bacterium]
MDKNKKAVAWLCSSHFVADVYSGFLTPLMPFIAAKLGFSLAIATMITSISQTISSTIQPIFGYFADTHTKRIFLFWGLLLSCLCYPLAPNTTSIWALCVLIVLGNLGGSMFHPQALGFIPLFSSKNSVYNMSLFVTAGTIGFAFGPIISSGIVQYFGYEKLLITPIIGLITLCMMFDCVPKINALEIKQSDKKFLNAFKSIFTNKTMVILLTIGMLKTLIQSSCSIMMPFLWKDLGHSPIYIGFAMFLFLFAGGIGSFTSHIFEKKYGAKFVLYCSMILPFPLMILFTASCEPSPILSLIIFILMGYVIMFAQPIVLIMAQRTLPQYKSIVSGIINGFTWGIVAALLIALGIVAENIGIREVLTALAILPVLFCKLVKHLPNTVED